MFHKSDLNIKNLFSDKRSIFKFIGFLVVLTGITLSIVNAFTPWPVPINRKIPTVTSKDIGDVLFNWGCFFTTESNLFILTSFFFLWIRSDLENKKGTLGSYNYSLAFTVYITVTFLVYNLILLPTGLPKGPLNWSETIILHMISPILYIVYFIFMFDLKGSQKVTFKQLFKKDIFKIYSYPIVWFIFVELRGLSRLHSGVESKENSAYLYFFLNPDKPQILLPVFFGVFFLSALLTMLYIFLTNKRALQESKSESESE